MKNKNLKNLGILFIGILFFSCQDLQKPEFTNFLYDGPEITITSPSASGSTVIRSKEATAPITITFKVVDDLGVASVNVKVNDTEIANYTDFANNRLIEVDNLVFDNVTTGVHTLTITAKDINDVVITETTTFEKVDIPPYTPMFDGEIFYMPFNGDYAEAISGNGATEAGSPGFAGESKMGSNAYAGATDSYLTYPTAGLLDAEFSASFWYKLNADPDRAGILVIGPPDTANPDAQNNRKSGFRFFRENAGGKQRFKLNVGNGTADTWVDGGAAADVDPAVNDWVHMAFTISGTEARVYINGNMVKESAFTGIDWAGCDLLSIMSGAPRFEAWNHKADLSYMDELRLFNKVLTQKDISNLGAQGSKTFSMPFDGSYTETISDTDALQVGSPGFAGESKEGSNAYAGATGSYLTFPTAGLLGNELSATFWYKLNADPDRAGILVIGPPDPAKPNAQNNRKSGFRFFRENAGGKQRFKLNVGNGTADTWVDGGAAADVDPAVNDWVHMAFTISGTQARVYINGIMVKESAFTGIDWTGCDLLSIMSGVPRFEEWGHKADLSYMDELALYNKSLSQEEIQAIMN
ncbi:LamG-like jellyroll fold domain-containing protein [uncultured Polaribacter sp.]|uniref:LamG-like jellyroll fold domain-containing protein n=1 Tax=uncultured Polaribacter sp. TaxID=174711 RepID=UPI002603F026|nr:LamG-like jellyroll fold domain-containing protein [uncultured Polaribacter sp.]